MPFVFWSEKNTITMMLISTLLLYSIFLFLRVIILSLWWSGYSLKVTRMSKIGR